MADKIPFHKPITAKHALDLRAIAMVGKPDKAQAALEELIARNKALAKVANSRLARLEKAGITRWAYDRAISYTESEYGLRRFSTSKAVLFDGDLRSYIVNLQINIQEMSKFINSKASTIRGNRAIDLEVINTFRDDWGIKISKKEESDFLDLIASDDFQMLKKAYVDSGNIMLDLADLTNDYKVSIEDISKAFSKVVKGDATYDVALEELGYKI